MSPEKAKRARGRPRAFDTAVALDGAIDVFLTHGYDGASLDQVMDRTGLAKASLYAAFGTKEALYLQAIAHYVDTLERAIAHIDGLGLDFEETLLAYYEAAAEVYFGGDIPRGCLVMCTATVAAATSPAIRDAVADAMARLDRIFLSLFERAATVPRDHPLPCPPPLAAKLALATLQSMALRTRAGAARAEIDGLARETAAFLCR